MWSFQDRPDRSDSSLFRELDERQWSVTSHSQPSQAPRWVSVTLLVSLDISYRSRTAWRTPHSPVLAITGLTGTDWELRTFLMLSNQPWKPVGKILNPTCTPTTPGGGTNRISYRPAPLFGLSPLYKLSKYILFDWNLYRNLAVKDYDIEILE